MKATALNGMMSAGWVSGANDRKEKQPIGLKDIGDGVEPAYGSTVRPTFALALLHG